MDCWISGCVSRLTPQELATHLHVLLENLFGAFEFPDSAENPYLMKCVMRVVECTGPHIRPVAQVCLQVRSSHLSSGYLWPVP